MRTTQLFTLVNAARIEQVALDQQSFAGALPTLGHHPGNSPWRWSSPPECRCLKGQATPKLRLGVASAAILVSGKAAHAIRSTADAGDQTW